MPGQSWAINNLFQIPANIQLTVPVNCATLIRFYHKFIVQVVLEGLLNKDICAEYTVVVATRGGQYTTPNPAKNLEVRHSTINVPFSANSAILTDGQVLHGRLPTEYHFFPHQVGLAR